MNRIDFDDFFAKNKKKKNIKEVIKQIELDDIKKDLKPNISKKNRNVKFEDAMDMDYELPTMENKLDLSSEKEKYFSINSTNKQEFIYCPNCKVRLLKKNLKKHLKKCKKIEHKQIEKRYICQCKNCGKKLSSISALYQHMKDKHAIKSFPQKNSTQKILNKLNEQKKLKDKLVSLNQTLSIITKEETHNYILNNILIVDKSEILKLLKDYNKKYAHKYIEMQSIYLQLNGIENGISLKKIINIECSYCKDLFFSKKSLLTHIKDKHKESLSNFLKENNINKSYCKCCDELIFNKEFQKHFKSCSKMNCEYCNEKLCKDDYQEHLSQCFKYKEYLWEQNSKIKDSTTLTNIEKHQAKRYQFKEDEELDPDLIDEDEYQKTFGIELDEKSQRVRDRVAFEHTKLYYKEEEEDKSEIKIFLSKMYKGYCQVCGFTFRKTNGENSFERFNWNDKRVVKVKKNLVSTADSLSLCRNCSANIKWGAFYPNFVDTIREIEDFKNKSYDEIREKLHKVVDEDIPKIFEPLLNFDDVYALEIELGGKPRNIYFTNEHLLQFVTYLQKEDEVEEEVKIKKKIKREKHIIDKIYSYNSWLQREETIPLNLAESFIRASAYWNHPTAHRYVSAPKHANNIYNNKRHGWAVDFGSNSFLVGKAIERCKNEINKYIEQKTERDFDELKIKLAKHISGAVATANNYEYSYPIEDGYMKFGVQAIDVIDGVNFLIRKLGLENLIS